MIGVCMNGIKQKIIMLLMPVIIILILLYLAIVAGGEFCYYFAIVPTAAVFYLLSSKPKFDPIYKKRLVIIFLELFVVAFSFLFNILIESGIGFLLLIINCVYYFKRCDNKKTPIILLMTDPYLYYSFFIIISLAELNRVGILYY